jgi:hypothetical protein
MTTKIVAHPNPFLSAITLEVTAQQDKHGIVRMFDMNGRIIKMISWYFKKGVNVTKIADLDRLGNGTYVLDVINEQGEILQKTKVEKH